MVFDVSDDDLDDELPPKKPPAQESEDEDDEDGDDEDEELDELDELEEEKPDTVLRNEMSDEEDSEPLVRRITAPERKTELPSAVREEAAALRGEEKKEKPVAASVDAVVDVEVLNAKPLLIRDRTAKRTFYVVPEKSVVQFATKSETGKPFERIRLTSEEYFSNIGTSTTTD